MDLSPEKLFMVALVALMVLGPQRLPQAARTAGKALAEVRRISAGFQAEVGDVMAAPRSMVTELRRGVGTSGGAGEPAGALVRGPEGVGAGLPSEARDGVGAGPTGPTGPAAGRTAPAQALAPDDAALN